MNNTIEVFEHLQYLSECETILDFSQDDWKGMSIKQQLTKAITTLKALESAEGLPEKRTKNCSQDDLGAGWMDGHNYCLDLCRIPYAKQILKVKELQEQLSNWLQLELDYNKRIKELEEALNTLMNEVFSGQASMSSYGYKKAQRAKIKDIENG